MPNIDPSIDAMHRLSHASRAAKRLRTLGDERDRRLGARAGLGGQLSDAADDLRHARRVLRGVREAHESHRATDGQLSGAERDAAAAEREHARIEKLYEEANARLSLTANLIDGAVKFLNALPANVRVDDAEPVGKRGPKPSDMRAAVDADRAKIAKLRAEIERVENARVPASEAKARAHAMVDELIERGRPNIAGLFAAAPAEIRWPTLTHMPIHAGVARVPAFDVTGVLAWLGPKTLRSRLEAEIDALADDASAVPAAERDGRLANLRAQLLECERREVALIDAAAEGGHVIEHRPDVDPRAVLAIEVSDGAASRDAAA